MKKHPVELVSFLIGITYFCGYSADGFPLYIRNMFKWFSQLI